MSQRKMLIHAKHGREESLCGRGASNPAFVTPRIEEVTCPLCKSRIAAQARITDEIVDELILEEDKTCGG